MIIICTSVVFKYTEVFSECKVCSASTNIPYMLRYFFTIWLWARGTGNKVWNIFIWCIIKNSSYFLILIYLIWFMRPFYFQVIKSSKYIKSYSEEHNFHWFLFKLSFLNSYLHSIFCIPRKLFLCICVGGDDELCEWVSVCEREYVSVLVGQKLTSGCLPQLLLHLILRQALSPSLGVVISDRLVGQWAPDLPVSVPQFCG